MTRPRNDLMRTGVASYGARGSAIVAIGSGENGTGGSMGASSDSEEVLLCLTSG